MHSPGSLTAFRCACLLARRGMGRSAFHVAVFAPTASADGVGTRPFSKEAAEDGQASTSDSGSAQAVTGLGWLAGPAANLPNKTRAITEEWEEFRDAAGELRYRSILTGEVTVPNAPKPDTWTEVVDKKTGLIYYWNKKTNDTTALGEPKPGRHGRAAAPESEHMHQLGDGRAQDKGPSLMGLVANPLVLGVSIVAVGAIAYEVLLK